MPAHRPLPQPATGPTGIVYVGPSLGRSLVGLAIALARGEEPAGSPQG